jgi:hypothetical protein
MNVATISTSIVTMNSAGDGDERALCSLAGLCVSELSADGRMVYLLKR